MSGLWQRLGFKQNPYFATPIEIDDHGRNLFVGRSAEIRRMLLKWDEPNGCVTVIGGHIGTGKTSFLNVCQYLSMKGIRDFGLPIEPPKLIPAFTKVQLESGLSDAALLARTLHSAAESTRRAYNASDLKIATEVSEIVEWVESFKRTISVSHSGGIEALGFGATGERSTSKEFRSLEELTVDGLLAKLRALAEAVRAGGIFRGCVVAIDNIEIVDTKYVLDILNRYRDTLFSIPGLWWVLIGQRGLYDLLAADAPRVAQRIKGTETSLAGLEWDDFQLAIEARVDAFRMRPNALGPIGQGLLRQLFDASAGEIRYVFQMADQIVTDALAEDPSLSDVPPDFAEQLLKLSVHEQISRLRLSSREQRVLRKICDEHETRPKNYKDYGFANAPHFIQSTLQPLQEKGLLTHSTQGNAAMYSPRSLARLAHAFHLLGDAIKDGSQAEADTDKA